MADMTVKVPFLTRLRYFSVENEFLEDRLTVHLKGLRKSESAQPDVDLTPEDEAKLKRRAKRIREFRKGYVSSRTLKREDQDRLLDA